MRSLLGLGVLRFGCQDEGVINDMRTKMIKTVSEEAKMLRVKAGPGLSPHQLLVCFAGVKWHRSWLQGAYRFCQCR